MMMPFAGEVATSETAITTVTVTKKMRRFIDASSLTASPDGLLLV
jgi:hypothetical protein